MRQREEDATSVKTLIITALAAIATAAAASSAGATFPGENGEIGFANGRIYVSFGDGSDPRPLELRTADGAPVDTSALRFYTPDWSPDGSKIALVGERVENGRNNTDIYVANAGGSDLRRLTYDPAGDSAPAWSPDGRNLAFLSRRASDDPSGLGLDLYLSKRHRLLTRRRSGRVRTSCRGRRRTHLRGGFRRHRRPPAHSTPTETGSARSCPSSSLRGGPAGGL